MPKKTIVFFADGTWNGADSTVDDHAPDAKAGCCEERLTNVCKSFAWLEGDIQPGGQWGGAEMEKVLLDAQGEPVQIAKYIHGVGTSKLVIDKVAGGAFGVGVIARIARGYTYISRNYVPGDSIVIVGFSRGAYTARALAGLIAGQGLLKPDLASADDNARYDTAAEAWFRWRHKQDTTLQRLLDGLTEFMRLHKAFPNPKSLNDNSFVPVDIAAVAVWDTVGELGIPFYHMGAVIDLFKFCDNQLNPKVKLGIHAVSIDEERLPFTPTLWAPDGARVSQRLFAGGHCDVGGGYAEHGLSDIPLLWIVERLKQPDIGLKFKPDPPAPASGDPFGPRHRAWMDDPAWRFMGVGRRKFPEPPIEIDDSVRKRMTDQPEVLFGDGTNQAPYLPGNI
jgi:hypothetical protein